MLRNPQHAYRHDDIRASPNKKGVPSANKFASELLFIWLVLNAYIIPPMPAPAGIAGVSSLMLATADSVVRNVEATLVAF